MSAAPGPAATIALTCGESAGIGPDLCLEIARTARGYPLVCLADHTLLQQRARRLRLECLLREYHPGEAPTVAAGELTVLHLPLAVPAVPGQLDARNAPWVLRLIERAVDGCRRGEFAALVTAPVQKSIINDAGLPFTGHTEYLATLCGAPLPVMLLVAGSLRVALATTHLPLRDVPGAISRPGLLAVLGVLDQGLRQRFGIERPRIAVCGLNPHAGEGGHLGSEERQVIEPAVQEARQLGLDVRGPYPADTLFVPRNLEGVDAVLAMYHDQGLPVLKHAGFGAAVNVTLGLPIIRTSVDHGTALDLAGTGRADAGSLRAAIELAVTLGARAQHR
ncbi:MAG TPA: 4-hydroxythreonine-4-phosphate dehydrogenase PdxA [Steroidobacteraceae bacterium]|nr:4-hydroxythreonine-4-phosphate dehydrogenase PdxA [Steroidobacteraceae bacterium]